jgi:hypothetical protein
LTPSPSPQAGSGSGKRRIAERGKEVRHEASCPVGGVAGIVQGD